MANTLWPTYAVAYPESGAFLWPRDPGWKKIRIRDKHPRSFFCELRNSFFDADSDTGSESFWSTGDGKKISHPVSVINIPDTQHCNSAYFNNLMWSWIFICGKQLPKFMEMSWKRNLAIRWSGRGRGVLETETWLYGEATEGDAAWRRNLAL